MAKPNKSQKNKKRQISKPSSNQAGTKQKVGTHKAAPQKQKRSAPHQRPVKSDTGPKLTPLDGGNRFFFSRNAIEAAIKNPARKCVRLICTERAEKTALSLIGHKQIPIDIIQNEDLLASVIPQDSPHQGIVLEVCPLAAKTIHDLPETERQLVLILDQVTDPQNVGACLRAGAALGATALITPDRHCPTENGTIARTSAGGIEILPWIRVGNLSKSLNELKEQGFWIVGMDGDTDTSLKNVQKGGKIALVMGSEGKGMRPLTRKHCDIIAKIPMTGAIESLNVATAAAIAVYELGQ